MLGQCQQCGYEAGWLNLSQGLCHDCLNKASETKSKTKTSHRFLEFLVTYLFWLVPYLLVMSEVMHGGHFIQALALYIVMPFISGSIAVIFIYLSFIISQLMVARITNKKRRIIGFFMISGIFHVPYLLLLLSGMAYVIA